MRIDLDIKDGISHVLPQLTTERLRGQFMGNMVRAWDQGTQEIVGIAVKERFTGKGPFPVSQNKLGVVTGRLRRSIRSTRAQVNTSSGEITTEAGSNVAHFAAHEFGFKGTQHVRGHTRKNSGRSQFTRGKMTKGSRDRFKGLMRDRLTEGKGQLYSHVRPHGRKVDIPARAPLGTALNSDRARNIMRGKIRNAARQTLEAIRNSTP